MNSGLQQTATGDSSCGAGGRLCFRSGSPVVFGTAASSPNPRRDVLIDFPSEAIPATTSADRTLVVDAQPDAEEG